MSLYTSFSGPLAFPTSSLEILNLTAVLVTILDGIWIIETRKIKGSKKVPYTNAIHKFDPVNLYIARF